MESLRVEIEKLWWQPLLKIMQVLAAAAAAAAATAHPSHHFSAEYHVGLI